MGDRTSLTRQAVCDVHGRELESDDALAAFLTDPDCYLYIAVAEDEAVGSLTGYRLVHPHCPQPQFRLYEIDVKEAWRGQGRDELEGNLIVFLLGERCGGPNELFARTPKDSMNRDSNRQRAP